MTSIPAVVEKRLKAEIPRFQKILEAARDRDVNEADTVIIITDMLEQIFGMDKYTEVTREYAIKGTFVDLAVKIDGKIEYLIEVKAIGLELKDHHLRQAVDYAAKEGIRWVILTNGICWEVHRVIVSGQVSNEQVVSFNFLEISSRRDHDLETLFMLCRRGVSKDLFEEYYERQQACNRFTIGALLSSDPILNIIRKLLRQMTPGLNVSHEEIREILEQQIIKREVLQSEQAIDAQKKIRRSIQKKSLTKKKANQSSLKPDENPIQADIETT